MFEFQEVTKKFREDFWKSSFYALNHLSFSIKSGSIVGFLGANGAGKTTSMKIMMEFISKDSGTVNFSSELGKNRKEVFSKIGYLPERPYFYPNISGRDFLHFMGEFYSMTKNQRNEQILKWSKIFNIAFALDRKISTYSKGMLQRIGFVSALIHDPLLIILDEPLSGLDPVGRKELKDVIVHLHSLGKTIFFSSHIVPDMEEICHSVIFIEKGKLVYQGSIDQLLEDNIKPEIIIKTPLLPAEKKIENASFVTIEGGRYSVFKAALDQKDKLIKELATKEIELHSLTPIKLSLEEIFYKVKHGNH